MAALREAPSFQSSMGGGPVNMGNGLPHTKRLGRTSMLTPRLTVRAREIVVVESLHLAVLRRRTGSLPLAVHPNVVHELRRP